MIIILNGSPRSGKSSIAKAMVGWTNLGVDHWREHRTPEEFQPGIGLRPGGERPDLEQFVRQSYQELFTELANRDCGGENVVVDLGIHDAYSKSLGIRAMANEILEGANVVWCHVCCSTEINAERRRRSGMTDDPERIAAWEIALPSSGDYDLVLNTDSATPEELAGQILSFLKR